jgi:hypothetical protein
MAARDMTAVQDLAYPVPPQSEGVRVAIGATGARIARGAAAAGLIVLMVVGGFVVWVAVPVAALWLASQLSDSAGSVSTASVIVAAVGIPAGIAAGVKTLRLVELLYLRLTGRPVDADRTYVPAWRRSVSDTQSRPNVGVLDRIMIASVLTAASAFVAWFVLFAGTSLPS